VCGDVWCVVRGVVRGVVCCGVVLQDGAVLILLEPQQALAQHLLSVCGLEFGVWGSGFRVQGSGFRVQGSGFRVQGLGFKA